MGDVEKGIFIIGVSFLCLLSTFDVEATNWCRIDDPGPVEQERQQKEISNSQIGQIQCAQIQPADLYPAKLILPMPCGRNMVFRRIDIQLAHFLDHQTGTFGRAGIKNLMEKRNQRKYVTQGAWEGNLSGAFTQNGNISVEGPLVRSYYIGAYEVSEPQYQIWQSGLFRTADDIAESDKSCGEHHKLISGIVGTRVYPATEVAWIDAINFANDYSEWLISRDQGRIEKGLKPALPWEFGATGFLRLPTEEEWEYAAKAGDISPVDNYEGLYAIENDAGTPTKPELEDIAFVLNAQSVNSGGRVVSFIGRKRPNLSGLYDIIGNADEIVMDLFQLIRPDGKVGQFGGYQVRGGNATLNKIDLNIYSRSEVPFYHSKGLLRRETTGFRLVLSAPVLMNSRDDKYQPTLGNPFLEKAIENGMDALKNPKNISAGGDNIESLAFLVGELTQDVMGGELKLRETNKKLQEIHKNLVESTTKLNQRELELAEERLHAAVLSLISQQTLGRSIKSALLVTEKLVEDTFIQQQQNDSKDAGFCQLMLEQAVANLHGIARTESISDTNFQQYVELVYKLAKDSKPWIGGVKAKVQAKFSRLKLKSKGLTGLTSLVVSHVDEAQQNGGAVSTETLKTWRERVDFELNERVHLREKILEHPWVTRMVKGGNTPCL